MTHYVLTWKLQKLRKVFEAATLPVSALQQAFIWTTCHPFLKKKQKNSTTVKKKKEKKAYALSLTFLSFFFLNKNKSSSPQVKHNLTSKFSGMMGRE